jgi:hypothetical protein
LGIADLGPVQWAVLGWLVVFVWVDMAGGGKWLYWLYFGCGEIFGLRVDGGLLGRMGILEDWGPCFIRIR